MITLEKHRFPIKKEKVLLQKFDVFFNQTMYDHLIKHYVISRNKPKKKDNFFCKYNVYVINRPYDAVISHNAEH